MREQPMIQSGLTSRFWSAKFNDALQSTFRPCAVYINVAQETQLLCYALVLMVVMASAPSLLPKKSSLLHAIHNPPTKFSFIYHLP